MFATVGLAPSALALQWEQVGPTGGEIAAVAAGPTGSGKVYAVINGLRMYRSDDSGAHWSGQPGLPDCGLFWSPSPPSPIQVRSDGDVFVHCRPVKRSHDGGATWAPFSSMSFDAHMDGQLVFDPFVPSRAALRRGIQPPYFVALTANDGANWTFPTNDMPVLPWAIAFDPLHTGRMVGVGTEVTSGTYRTQGYESFDFGAHWTALGLVAMTVGSESPCFERTVTVDTLGRLFLNADCGLFRSVDSGATWQKIADFPGDPVAPIVADAAHSGRLVALSPQHVLYESHDAASTWQSLPAPRATPTLYDISVDGDLWIATTDGVFLYDSSNRSWISRNGGLYAHPVASVEAGFGNGLVLTATNAGYPYEGGVQSVDGGQNWTPWLADGVAAAQLVRNINLPSSLFALTSESTHTLYASSDGGVTWQLVTSSPSPAADQLATGLVPVGIQPGTVYGLHESCVADPFFGCLWTPQGVTKSVDGGATWFNMDNGVTAAGIYAISVSPADLQTAFGQASDALYVTRDGAQHWLKVQSPFGRVRSVTADPIDAARWYAVEDPSSNLWTSSDYGDHWTSLARPPIVSATYDLLINANDPRSVYAVGIKGDVSASSDRAAHWQSLVEPLITFSFAARSARLGAGIPTTLYAASDQGVLQLALPDVAASEPIPALGPMAIAFLAFALALLASVAHPTFRRRSRTRD